VGSPEISRVPSAEGLVAPEGRSVDGEEKKREGEVGGALGGVMEYGTEQEDDPVTWETSPLPRAETGDSESPVKVSVASRVMVHRWRAAQEALSRGRPPERDNRNGGR
jgi:hypothetical protein